MIFLRLSAALMLTIAAGIVIADEHQSNAEEWDRDVGKPAQGLVAMGWVGSPVSLEAVKGNTIVLAFWNTDVPWC